MVNEIDELQIAKTGVKGAMLNIGAAAISKFSSLIFYIILLRFISPEEGGIYFLYFAVASFIGVVGAFGTAESLARFIPFYEGAGKKERVRALVNTVLVAFVLFSVFTAFLTHASKDLIANSYNKELAKILWITLLSGISMSFGSVMNCILIGLKKFGSVAAYAAAGSIIKIILLVVFFMYFKATLEYAIYATVISSVLINIAMVFSVFFSLRTFPGTFKLLEIKEIWEITTYSIVSALNQFSSFIMSWTDTFVLAYYEISKVIGAYNSIASVARTLMQTLSLQIFTILVSMLAYLYGAKSKIFGPFVSNATRWSIYLTAPLVIASIFFAEEIIKLIFPVYVEYYWLLYLFVPGFFIAVFSLPARSALFAVGKTNLLFKSVMIGIIPNLVLNLMLIPKYGAIGAATATVCTYLLSEACVIRYAIKHTTFSFHPLLWKIILPTFAMGAVLFISYNNLFNFLIGNWIIEIIRIGFAFALSMLVYVLILERSGGINKTDRMIIDKCLYLLIAKVRAMSAKN